MVEVSDAEILLRYGTRWLRFTTDRIQSSTGAEHGFALTTEGRARVDDVEDEMDLAAERLTREIITG